MKPAFFCDIEERITTSFELSLLIERKSRIESEHEEQESTLMKTK